MEVYLCSIIKQYTITNLQILQITILQMSFNNRKNNLKIYSKVQEKTLCGEEVSFNVTK
jgi:hypothetical protein